MGRFTLLSLERKTGFEPATFSLARRCSTTEPLPLVTAKSIQIWALERAEGQNRTGDTSIFSAVLYLLSYLGLLCFLIIKWKYMVWRGKFSVKKISRIK